VDLTSVGDNASKALAKRSSASLMECRSVKKDGFRSWNSKGLYKPLNSLTSWLGMFSKIILKTLEFKALSDLRGRLERLSRTGFS
jgi:hypothetical protein